MKGDRTVFNNFRIANSSWVIRCEPGENKLQFNLSCGDNQKFIKEVKLWLVNPVLERANCGTDILYFTVTDYTLTKSQPISKTIWLNDSIGREFIVNDSLTLKVVIKLPAD